MRTQGYITKLFIRKRLWSCSAKSSHTRRMGTTDRTTQGEHQSSKVNWETKFNLLIQIHRTDYRLVHTINLCTLNAYKSVHALIMSS